MEENLVNSLITREHHQLLGGCTYGGQLANCSSPYLMQPHQMKPRQRLRGAEGLEGQACWP